MSVRWYILHGGKQLGPFSAEELRRGVSRGDVDPFDVVFQEGSAVRRILIDVDAIFDTDRAVYHVVDVEPSAFPSVSNPEPTRIARPFSNSGTRLDRGDGPAAPKEGDKDTKRYMIYKIFGESLGPLRARDVAALFRGKKVSARATVGKDGGEGRVPIKRFVERYEGIKKARPGRDPEGEKGKRPKQSTIPSQALPDGSRDLSGGGRAKRKQRKVEVLLPSPMVGVICVIVAVIAMAVAFRFLDLNRTIASGLQSVKRWVLATEPTVTSLQIPGQSPVVELRAPRGELGAPGDLAVPLAPIPIVPVATPGFSQPSQSTEEPFQRPGISSSDPRKPPSPPTSGFEPRLGSSPLSGGPQISPPGGEGAKGSSVTTKPQGRRVRSGLQNRRPPLPSPRRLQSDLLEPGFEADEGQTRALSMRPSSALAPADSSARALSPPQRDLRGGVAGRPSTISSLSAPPSSSVSSSFPSSQNGRTIPPGPPASKGPSSVVSPPLARRAVPRPAAPSLASLVGQSVTLTGVRYSVANLGKCGLKCRLPMTDRYGQPLTAVFFKGAFQGKLESAQGIATVRGMLKSEGGGLVLYLQQ